MQWFIYIDQELIGPFTKESLKEYLRSHNLPDSTLIKSSKMNNPMKYSSIFYSPEILAPDLPKLPILPEQAITKKIADKTFKTSTNKSVQDPEFLKRKNESETLKIKDPQIEVKTKSVMQIPSDDVTKQIISDIESLNIPSKKPVKLITSIVVIFAIILASYLYLKNYSPTFVRPNNMSLKTYKEAIRIHESSYLKTKLFLSKDKKTLWLITNNFATAKVRLSLDSIKIRVLTKEKVLVTSDSILKDGVAQFDKLIFESNDQIVDGEYMMNIENVSKVTKPLKYTLKKTEKSINYRQKILLSNFLENIFEQKLETYQTKINENNNEFTRELIQKYLTLKSMVEQIKDKFLETFSNTELLWSDRAKSFEEIYKNEFGPFFTSFVIANEKQYENINKKEFPNKIEIISDYTRLSRLAKDVGLTSVNIMNKYEKFNFSDADVEKNFEFKKSVIDDFDKVIKIYTDKIISLKGDEIESE